MALLPEIFTPGHVAHHFPQIHGKLNDLPNGKRDYGAVGDNAADDTSAIQTMLDEQKGGASWAGLPCYLPPGIYRVTQINSGHGGAKLFGAGSFEHANGAAGPTVLRAKAGFTGTILNGAARGQTISDLIIDGNGNAAAVGLLCDDLQDSVVQRVKFYQCQIGAKIQHGTSKSNIGLTFRDVKGQSCNRWAAAIYPDTTNYGANNNQDVLFDNFYAFQCGGSGPGTNATTGGLLLKSGGSEVRGGTFEGNTGAGIAVGLAADTSIAAQNVLTSPWAEGNSYTDVYLSHSVRTVWRDRFALNWISGASADAVRTYLSNNVAGIWNMEAIGSSSASKIMSFGDSNGRLIIPGYIEMTENSTPGVAPTNGARLSVRDNGSGKTQLGVIFQSGSFIVLATEV